MALAYLRDDEIMLDQSESPQEPGRLHRHCATSGHQWRLARWGNRDVATAPLMRSGPTPTPPDKQRDNEQNQIAQKKKKPPHAATRRRRIWRRKKSVSKLDRLDALLQCGANLNESISRRIMKKRAGGKVDAEICTRQRWPLEARLNCDTTGDGVVHRGRALWATIVRNDA